MKLKFQSSNNDADLVEFEAQYISENNKIIFDDLSIENTKIIIDILDEFNVNFKRVGNINMDILFSLNNDKIASYSNNLGVSFDFNVFTNKLVVKNDQIIVEYESNIMDYKQKHKIFIDLNNYLLEK